MAVRKVLIAVGLVCLVTPAALAMMRPNQMGDYAPQHVARSIFDQLQNLLDATAAQERIPAQAAPVAETRLPFWEIAEVVYPNLAGFHPRGDNGLHAGGPIDWVGLSYGSDAEPVVPGNAQRQAALTDPLAFAHERSDARRVTGAAGGSGGGSGSGSGGTSGGGQDVAELLLDVELPSDPATSGGGEGAVAVMPLPASVWMLLASLGGLALVGLSRSRRS